MDIARHLARVDQSQDCWSWPGARLETGYAIADVDGKTTLLHRAVYEALVGPIPGDLTIDHLCRNTSCINPAHMEPVTRRENILRGEGPTALNARKTHCPHGHEYAGANLWVDKTGRRHCRTCQRARTKAWWAKHGPQYRQARRAATHQGVSA